jgi:hypothetical protein
LISVVCSSLPLLEEASRGRELHSGGREWGRELRLRTGSSTAGGRERDGARSSSIPRPCRRLVARARCPDRRAVSGSTRVLAAPWHHSKPLLVQRNPPSCSTPVPPAAVNTPTAGTPFLAFFAQGDQRNEFVRACRCLCARVGAETS